LPIGWRISGVRSTPQQVSTTTSATRTNQRILERLRFRSLSEPPGSRDLSRRPSDIPESRPHSKNIRGERLESPGLPKAEL